LDELSDDFPEEFFKMKILPELTKSVEFGGGGPKVFGYIMKIGKKLSDEEFETRLNPFVLRLFSSPDRQLRVALLDNLPQMIDHFSQKLVTDKIFPQVVCSQSTTCYSRIVALTYIMKTAGFSDTAPLVREQTVKSVLTLITKLSDRTINGELLKCLARTANDEQPGIRTNTTICLGKIARNLGPSVSIDIFFLVHDL
jgi:SCY1-like protein 1